MTNPSAPASNGLVPEADSAPILENLTNASTPMLRSMPPLMTASYWWSLSPRTAAAEGRQAGRAGRVGGEVRAAQVEHVGDPPGDDVGQLTGHGVLGDLEVVVQEARPRLLDDLVLHLRGQGEQGLGLLQPLERFRQPDAHARDVVLLAADSVAEDDRDPLVVDIPARPAGVEQGLAGGGEGPALAFVHLVRDRRRDRQPPRDRVPVELADPAADPRVGLVPRGAVGGVVVLGVPALGRHLGDAVPPALDVGPERVAVGGLRHDRRDPDDGDRADGILAHGAVLP